MLRFFLRSFGASGRVSGSASLLRYKSKQLVALTPQFSILTPQLGAFASQFAVNRCDVYADHKLSHHSYRY